MKETYPELLRSMANTLGVQNVYDELNHQYPQFVRWSGSSHPKQHHFGEFGLVRHTWEVVKLGLNTISTLNLKQKVSRVEYYFAALFHDTGKMYDYEETPIEPGWQGTNHKRLIHHISRSALIWHDVVGKFPELNEKYHDAVLHDILAHHGQREYGSPVAPKSHAAWLLHLCDGISARMDDADRLDILKGP